MTAPVIRQYPGTIPDKGQAQTAFDTNVDAFLDWQALQFAPDLASFGAWADQLRAALIAGNLPPLTGRQLDALRVNASGNGVEFANVTAAGWALLDDANPEAQRATLGLQSLQSESLSSLDLGRSASGDRASLIDFHAYGEANSGVFGARVGRAPGTNGDLFVENVGTGRVIISSSGGINLNGAVLAPQGVAPLFACRAWVNFNGDGAASVRAAGNVSSISDFGTGDYRVNFATAMPNADYVANISFGFNTFPNASQNNINAYQITNLVGSFRLALVDASSDLLADAPVIMVSIFR